MGDILDTNVDPKYTISDTLWEGHQRRKIDNKAAGKGFGYSLFNADSPYTNTISVSGVTTSNIVEVGLSSSATDDQVKACMSASIAKITQANGSITLYAYGTKPTTNIPLSVVLIN